MLLGFIHGKRSRTGLHVTAGLNDKSNATIRVTEDEMAKINVDRHQACPKWNYTIKPQPRGQVHKGFRCRVHVSDLPPRFSTGISIVRKQTFL
jgi:hypothetical protein